MNTTLWDGFVSRCDSNHSALTFMRAVGFYLDHATDSKKDLLSKVLNYFSAALKGRLSLLSINTCLALWD